MNVCRTATILHQPDPATIFLENKLNQHTHTTPYKEKVNSSTYHQTQMYWPNPPKNSSQSIETYFLGKNRNKINPYKYHYTYCRCRVTCVDVTFCKHL